MERDEGQRLSRVARLCPLVETGIDVAGASENDPVLLGSQQGQADPSHELSHQIFFQDTITAMSAQIIGPMPGVEHYGRP